jgi:hypothetical protein
MDGSGVISNDADHFNQDLVLEFAISPGLIPAEEFIVCLEG